MLDRAMAQVVSRRPLTAEARDHVLVNSCEIYGGQSGTETGFSSICHYHSTVHSHISSGDEQYVR
jgi:hypothetical protein